MTNQTVDQEANDLLDRSLQLASEYEQLKSPTITTQTRNGKAVALHEKLAQATRDLDGLKAKGADATVTAQINTHIQETIDGLLVTIFGMK
jgi:hypothetical protein